MLRGRLIVLGLFSLQSPLCVAQNALPGVGELWYLAWQFDPQGDDQHQVPQLPTNDPLLDRRIEEALHEDSSACIEPLLLFLMKLYASHLHCCDQSYDIAGVGVQRSGVVTVFLRLTDSRLHAGPVEFYSSAMPYEYYKKHKSRYRSGEIRKEAARIMKEMRRIKKGI